MKAVFSNKFLMAGLVFGAALAIQCVLNADYRLHSPFYSGLICDSKVYYKWAENILNGDWFGREVFHQAPLYPYLIALLWLAFGKHYLTIYLAQALMTAFCALLTFLIAEKYFGRQAGLAAGLLCAFYGALNFYALKMLPDVPGVLLLLWLAYLLAGAVFPRQWFRAGCVCGLLIAARPHALMLPPLILLWIMTREDLSGESGCGRSAALSLKQFSIFLLPVIILTGLVALRNHMIEPGFVAVSSNGGENFFMGNNERADGIYCRLQGVAPDIEFQKTDVRDTAEARTGRKLASAEVSRYWLGQGLAFIRRDFPGYLRLESNKLKRMFSETEYTNMYFLWFERAEFTKTLALPAVRFHMILPMAIIGAVLFITRWRRYGLLYVMILLNALNMLIFYVDERYRLPMVPFLIVLGTGGVFRMLEMMRGEKSSWRGNIAILALPAAALGATFYIHHTEPARLAVEPQLYNNLAEVYYEKRDYQKSLAAFVKSIRLAAGNWEAELGIGKVLFAMGKKDASVKLYQEAFPHLDKELQTSCLRDHDLDALREYMKAPAGPLK